MNKKLLVSLESPQHGFMSLRLKAGDESFVTVVSHTPYDSLRDLVEALCDVLDNDCEATVKWNSEPEEYDFKLASSGDFASLSVIHYPGHRRSVESGSRVFSFKGLKSGMCRPFWEELSELSSRTLQDEFDRQWRREFPECELNELTKRIKALENDV